MVNRNFKGRKPKEMRQIDCWFCRTARHDRCMDRDYGVECVCPECHPRRRRRDRVPFSKDGTFKPRKNRKTYTAKQLAHELNEEPKKFRKFLRSSDSPLDGVGKGGRWEIESDMVEIVAKAYREWASRIPTRTKKGPDDEG